MSTRLGGYVLEFLVGNLLTSVKCCAMIGKHSTRAGQNKRKTGENEVKSFSLDSESSSIGRRRKRQQPADEKISEKSAWQTLESVLDYRCCQRGQHLGGNAVYLVN